MHQFGKAGLSADPTEGVAFYQLAASQGLDKAQRALGQMDTFGPLVIDRDDEGRRWLQLAVAQDDHEETDSEEYEDPYDSGGDGPYPNYWIGAPPPNGWVAGYGFIG